MSDVMILEEMRIRRLTYGDNKGSYEASITYSGKSGKVQLNLSPEISQELLRFCGDAIKRCSSKAADELTESVDFSILKANETLGLEDKGGTVA
jgi:hypothetical protein